MPDTRLVDVADSILDNLVIALTAEGIDVPTRRYMAGGDLVHDFAGVRCAEQFSISWQGSFQGVVSPGGTLINQPIVCSMPLVAQFLVLLTRCVPTITENGIAPSAAELDASGRELLTDSQTLAAVTVEQNVNLLPSPLMQIGITNLQPVGPLGGVGGVAMAIVVGLI